MSATHTDPADSGTTERNTFYGELVALPKGPHRLSAEEVSRSQLARLRAAIVAEVAAKGYIATTVAAIARRAKVSPNVFYARYADKEAGFLDAYETFVTVMVERVAEAAGAQTIEDLVEQMLVAYIGLMDRERDAARAFTIELDAAGPALRQRRRELYALAADVVCDGHARLLHTKGGSALTPKLALGIIFAAHGYVTDMLDSQPDRPITDVMPDARRLARAVLAGVGSK